MPKHRASTRSGSICHSAYGADTVTNGGFDSDAANWTKIKGTETLASVAGGVSGNCLQITAVAGGGGQGAKQDVTVSNATLYLASVYGKATADAKTGRVYGGSTDGGTEYFGGTAWDFYTTDWVNKQAIFLSTGTTVYIKLYQLTPAAGLTNLFDSISIVPITIGLG